MRGPNRREQAHSVSDYARVLDAADRRLGTRSSKSHARPIPKLPFHFDGLIPLLNSFATGSPRYSNPKVEEWNPFSQRPIFDNRWDYPSDLTQGFSEAIDHALRFINLAHEGMHVLLWEPLFAGRYRAPKKDFLTLSLGFEGFCFWYADIMLNREIRIPAPDGELVLTRQATSQEHVHPRRAFEALGISSPKEIMSIYQKAFLGLHTPFSRKLKEPLARGFARRFYSFYDGTRKPPMQMYKVLEDIGYFGEYFDRFCAVPGIPAILPASLLSMNPADDLTKYSWQVFTQGMSFIERMSPREIARVETRRALQTRAYFAFCLRDLLSKHAYVASGRFDSSPVLQALDLYLQRLENALHALGAAKPLGAIQRSLVDADRFYKTRVRAPLARANVRAGKRLQAVPALPGHTMLQLNEDRTKLTSGALTKFAGGVLSQIAVSKIDLQNEPRASKTLLRRIAKVAEGIESVKAAAIVEAPKRRAELSRAIDRVLSDELVFDSWSVALSATDPEQNTFREWLLRYE